jgi:hypothetical protein
MDFGIPHGSSLAVVVSRTDVTLNTVHPALSEGVLGIDHEKIAS